MIYCIYSWAINGHQRKTGLYLERVSSPDSIPPPSSFPPFLAPHLIQAKTNHHWILLVVARHSPFHHCRGLCRVDPHVQSLDLRSVIVSTFLSLVHIKMWIQRNVPNPLGIIEVLKYGLLLGLPRMIWLVVSHISRVGSQKEFHVIQRKAKVKEGEENDKRDQMAARCHRGQLPWTGDSTVRVTSRDQWQVMRRAGESSGSHCQCMHIAQSGVASLCINKPWREKNKSFIICAKHVTATNFNAQTPCSSST